MSDLTNGEIVAILKQHIRLVAKADDGRDMCPDCGDAMYWRVKEGCLEACAVAILDRLRSLTQPQDGGRS